MNLFFLIGGSKLVYIIVFFEEYHKNIYLC